MISNDCEIDLDVQFAIKSYGMKQSKQNNLSQSTRDNFITFNRLKCHQIVKFYIIDNNQLILKHWR